MSGSRNGSKGWKGSLSTGLLRTMNAWWRTGFLQIQRLPACWSGRPASVRACFPERKRARHLDGKNKISAFFAYSQRLLNARDAGTLHEPYKAGSPISQRVKRNVAPFPGAASPSFALRADCPCRELMGALKALEGAK